MTSARMQLKGKLVVTANEVTSIDEDTVKEWTGSDTISARGHYQATEQFTGSFNCVIFTMQLDKMIKLKKDGGLDRRVVAAKILNSYAPWIASAQQLCVRLLCLPVQHPQPA